MGLAIVILGLAVFIGAHAFVTHREHDEQSGRDDEIAVAFPKLLQLFAPDFLIDLMENVRHFNALQPAMKVVSAGSRPRPERAVN